MRRWWIALVGALVIGGLSTACGNDGDDGNGGFFFGESESEGEGVSEGESEGEGGFVDDCDGNGNCGDCFVCSDKQGLCADESDACDKDVNCVAMTECVNLCDTDDQDCFWLCFDDYPGGQEEYWALLVCMYCDICPDDCDAQGC